LSICFEVAKHFGHLIEWNGLSPNVSAQSCTSQSGSDVCLRVVLFEIVDKCFTFHSKGIFEERNEICGRNCKLLEARRDGEAQNGGMHFGRRCESSRRQSEQFFHFAVKLRGGGEQPVIA